MGKQRTPSTQCTPVVLPKPSSPKKHFMLPNLEKLRKLLSQEEPRTQNSPEEQRTPWEPSTPRTRCSPVSLTMLNTLTMLSLNLPKAQLNQPQLKHQQRLQQKHQEPPP